MRDLQVPLLLPLPRAQRVLQRQPSVFHRGNTGDSSRGDVTVRSAFGPTLSFRTVYNTKLADGSHSRSDTAMGYGWTHSYNTLLSSQRGHMFRLGPDGRITKYTLGVGNKYTVTPGYFETLVKN